MSTPEISLTAVEATELDELEQVIETGLVGFVEVGEALSRVRDQKLYRVTHATFEHYLRDRWNLSRSYAYRQIDAAEVARAVSPIGNTPAPATESVARQLAPLKDRPEELRQTWNNVVELHGPKPTAGQVHDVVAGELCNFPARGRENCIDVVDDDAPAGDLHARPLSEALERRTIAKMGRLEIGKLDHYLDEGFLDALERVPQFDYDDFLGELRASERVLRRLKRSIEERRP